MSEPQTTVTDLGLQCPECDYNLTGAPAGRCPWCGWLIDPALVVACTDLSRGNIARYGVAAASLATAGVTILVMTVLLGNGGGLSSLELLAVLGAFLISAGHLGLAGLVVFSRRAPWPLRFGDAASLLGKVAWSSVILGIIGALPALSFAPTRLVVSGAVVNGVLEFLITAVVFSLPGWMLLAFRMITFRQRASVSTNRIIRADSAQENVTPCASFTIDLFGRFSRQQVNCTYRDIHRETHPALEAAITRAWDAECALAEEKNRTLFNGKLLRLISHSHAVNELHMELGPTNYRDFLGTNLHNAAIAEEFGVCYLSNALGVSAVVLTRDGFLALGRRSDRVASHAGFLHAFGGMIDEADRAPDGTVNLFASIMRELQEELTLLPAELSDLRIIGIARDSRIRQPELIFEATTSLKRDSLQARFRPELSGGEHDNIEWVRAEPDSLIPFLANSPLIAPVAQAALLLWGRQSFGTNWYEQACFMQYGELPKILG